MSRTAILKSILAGTAATLMASAANAENFNIPAGDLASALDAYSAQTGISLMVSSDAVRGLKTRGAKGDLTANDALSRILSGTGFATRRYSTDSVAIIRNGEQQSEVIVNTPMQLAQAAAPRTAVETVTVTSSKLGGADVQSIPIAITALSQEQLTATQTAGGPDLVKQVPNLTFSKTNFTGYNIQIRGIGTQAISVTTDPAVAVAFNDVPFIRNHFFEQEFYDVSQVEVLRGPQGTLYGRNATAGVVNLISAKPTDQFEAMASADIGNYKNRRFEGMINLPIVDDRLDLRLAGEWTKRDGYSFNTITNSPIDGRDLWSSRMSIRFKPSENFDATFVWEHFQENDDRLRSSKQLCKTDPSDKYIGTVHISGSTGALGGAGYYSQGCLPTSLYSADAFEAPNGDSLPYGLALKNAGGRIEGNTNIYASTLQSRDLRVIESTLDPVYKVKNDVIELNAEYSFSSGLSLTSQTGFSQDFLYSTEDFNRFNTTPDIFISPYQTQAEDAYLVWDGNYRCNDGSLSVGGNNCQDFGSATGYFCDPQLGCSTRIVAEDVSDEHAWQLSQEVRMASTFSGPFNFSVGGNFLHYETEENYHVFINALTLMAALGNQAYGWTPGVTDQHQCLVGGFQWTDPHVAGSGCVYIDPNPIGSVNNNGHNYFLNQNPYVLSSYAGFGEIYYQPADDLKLTGGLRWTDDQKHFVDIPSEILTNGWGYPPVGVVDQEWREWTGRAALNWTPKLDITDQTLVYGSYSHGYKAGGANPPGAVLLIYNDTGREIRNPVHPLTFAPEFINSYELGTKNTLLDGALTFNAAMFYYDYKGYQISEIVDRTAINLNFDATVKGAEIEATWEPTPGLRFKFAGGYEDTRLADGSKAVDLMDRTGGHTDWFVKRPFLTQASNCIMPVAVLEAGGDTDCGLYNLDPNSYGAPNNGQGFDKDLGGNKLPNAPPFTISASADYTVPLTSEWAGTAHIDYYWQDYSWARVFNDNPYDRLRGYTNINLALILTSQDGWQVMGYLKNIFDTTAITGGFLNSDDTGLTTNVFLTDPRLFGVRVTKNF